MNTNGRIPIIDNPTPQDVIPHLRKYKIRHKDGGSLHLVLVEGSIAYSTIRLCLHYAKMYGDIDAILLGNLLMKLSHDEKKYVLLNLGA
jgi:hypothetical protein